MTTLENYLRENVARGVIDFALRAGLRDGRTVFYIHPNGKDGETLDLLVTGNGVEPSPYVVLAVERRWDDVGYRQWQLVEVQTGLVVGSLHGGVRTWNAYVERLPGQAAGQYLGQFLTEEQAKAAVERAVEFPRLSGVR